MPELPTITLDELMAGGSTGDTGGMPTITVDQLDDERSDWFDENGILTWEGYQNQSHNGIDVLETAGQAFGELLSGFKKIPGMVAEKGLMDSLPNVSAGFFQALDDYATIAKGVAGKLGDVGVRLGGGTEEDIQYRKYLRYRDLAENMHRVMVQRKSVMGDWLRSVGLNQAADDLDAEVDPQVANSLSLVMDPTTLFGGGVLKLGSRVAGATARKTGEQLAKQASKKAAGGVLQGAKEFASAPATKTAQAVTRGAGKALEAAEAVARKVPEVAAARPFTAGATGAAIGAIANDDPASGAGLGFLTGFFGSPLISGVGKLPRLSRAANTLSGMAQATKGGIGEVVRAGKLPQDVLERLARYDSKFVNLALRESGELANNLVKGAGIGAGLGYLAADGEGAASGLGTGIAGGLMGFASRPLFATAGRVYFSRGQDGGWVRIGDSPLSALSDEDLAINYLARMPEEQRNLLTERLPNAQAIAMLARGEAFVGGANRAIGADVDVLYLTGDRFAEISEQNGGPAIANGATVDIDGKATVLVNLDVTQNPVGTLFHEAIHGVRRLRGKGENDPVADAYGDLKQAYLGVVDADGNQVAPGAYTREELLDIEAEYLDLLWPDKRNDITQLENRLEAGDLTPEAAEGMQLRLDRLRAYEQRRFDAMNRHQQKPMAERLDYIFEEILAEDFSVWAQKARGDVYGATPVLPRVLGTDLARYRMRMVDTVKSGLEALGVRFDIGGNPVESSLFNLKKDPVITRALERFVDARRRIFEGLETSEASKQTTVTARDLVKLPPASLERFRESGMFALDEQGNILNTAGQRYQGNGDAPRFLTARERKAMERNVVEAITNALKTADEEGGLRSMETNDGATRWTGVTMNEAQLKAVMALPDKVLPASMKAKIQSLHNIIQQGLETGMGRRLLLDYYKALSGGRYTSKARMEARMFAPFGWEITKAGNLIVKGLDYGRMEGKLNRWSRLKKFAKWFDDFQEDARPGETAVDGFRRAVLTYLENQAKGIRNPDGKKKNKIADFLNVVTQDTAFDIPQRMSTDTNRDTLIRSFRVDRMANVDDGGNFPLVDYGKMLGRFQPTDADYMAAVEAGDLEAAQRMVDEAAKAVGGLSLTGRTTATTFFRGETTPRIRIYDVNQKLIGEDGVVWVTDNPKVADEYVRPIGRVVVDDIFDTVDSSRKGEAIDGTMQLLVSKTDQGSTGYFAKLQHTDPDWVFLGGERSEAETAFENFAAERSFPVFRKSDFKKRLFVFPSRPFVVDAKGATKDSDWGNLVLRAKRGGHDSVIVRNVVDTPFQVTGERQTGDGYRSTVVGVLNPKLLKSADPITYDDAGNVIPLSKRFNAASDDIRYQPSPIDVENLRKMDVGDKSRTQVGLSILDYPENPNPDSVTLIPRMGLVNRKVAGVPDSYSEVQKIVQSQVDRINELRERDPEFAKRSAMFYEDMARVGLGLGEVMAPANRGKYDAADMMLRVLALGSPRSDVTSNSAKSSRSTQSVIGGTSGHKIGTAPGQRGAKKAADDWHQGRHFDVLSDQSIGADDKVRNFYINSMADLIDMARAEGDTAAVEMLTTRVARSLGLIKETEALTPDIATTTAKFLDGLATVDMWDMAAKGYAHPAYIIKKGRKSKSAFAWSVPKQRVRSDFSSPIWKKAMSETMIKDGKKTRAITSPMELDYQYARAFQIDGRKDWNPDNWAKRKAKGFDEKTEWSYYKTGDEGGLSPGGGGPVYDAQQAIDGLIADTLNQQGAAAFYGKEKLKARNAQEILWAIEKMDNPVLSNRNLVLFGDRMKPLVDHLHNMKTGDMRIYDQDAAARFMEKIQDTYGKTVDQSIPIEVVSQGETPIAEIIRQKEAEIGAQALTESVADGLMSDLQRISDQNDAGVTFMSVETSLGGYTEGGQANVAPNIVIGLRGRPDATGRIMRALSIAWDQDGGNLIRRPTVEEVASGRDTNKALVLDTRGMTAEQKAAVYQDLSQLKDANGETFLTGFTATPDGMFIGDQFYEGDMVRAIADSDAKIKSILEKHKIPESAIEDVIIETHWRPAPEEASSVMADVVKGPMERQIIRLARQRITGARSGRSGARQSFDVESRATGQLEERQRVGMFVNTTTQKADLVPVLEQIDIAVLDGRMDPDAGDALKKSIKDAWEAMPVDPGTKRRTDIGRKSKAAAKRYEKEQKAVEKKVGKKAGRSEADRGRLVEKGMAPIRRRNLRKALKAQAKKRKESK